MSFGCVRLGCGVLFILTTGSAFPLFRTGDAEISCSSGALLLPVQGDLVRSGRALSVEGGVTIRSSEPGDDITVSWLKNVGFGAGHQPGGV